MHGCMGSLLLEISIALCDRDVLYYDLFYRAMMYYDSALCMVIYNIQHLYNITEYDQYFNVMHICVCVLLCVCMCVMCVLICACVCMCTIYSLT